MPFGFGKKKKPEEKQKDQTTLQDQQTSSSTSQAQTIEATSSPTASTKSKNTPTARRHLCDIAKVQVTSRDPLTPKELRYDLQKLVPTVANSKIMTITIEHITNNIATSVSKQQELYRMLSRKEHIGDLVAILTAGDEKVGATSSMGQAMNAAMSSMFNTLKGGGATIDNNNNSKNKNSNVVDNNRGSTPNQNTMLMTQNSTAALSNNDPSIPSTDAIRFYSSTLVAFVAAEAHSKLAASFLGVGKEHSVAATPAELEQELDWFFTRYDPKHLHFAKTIASHFHSNIAMQVGLARFLFQELLWVVLGISREQDDAMFPYLQTVDAALGLGTVMKLHESYQKVLVWNQQRSEKVRQLAHESVTNAVMLSQQQQEKEKSETQQTNESEDEKNKKNDQQETNDTDGEKKPSADATGDKTQEQASADGKDKTKPDNDQQPNQATTVTTVSNTATTTSINNNNLTESQQQQLMWSPQATGAVILTAEFALRQQGVKTSNNSQSPSATISSATLYQTVPPLYRDTFGWLAQPWVEIPVDFKHFPKPFVLFDLWALDTIHRLAEFRAFVIVQLQSFLLEESGAFTVIVDARKSSEQVLRRKAAQQYIIVQRALEMLVATEADHRLQLESQRSGFLQEAKQAMVYAGEYREQRAANMFTPVNPVFHQKFHAAKLIIEENAREIQRIGRAVGEKQRLQIEAAKREEQLKQFAGRSHFTSNNRNNKGGTTPNNNRNNQYSSPSASASRNYLHSSSAMKRILSVEKQHRSHLLETLSDMDVAERELTKSIIQHSHKQEVEDNSSPARGGKAIKSDKIVFDDRELEDFLYSHHFHMNASPSQNRFSPQNQKNTTQTAVTAEANNTNNAFTKVDAEPIHEDFGHASSSDTMSFLSHLKQKREVEEKQQQQDSIHQHISPIPNTMRRASSFSSSQQRHQQRPRGMTASGLTMENSLSMMNNSMNSPTSPLLSASTSLYLNNNAHIKQSVTSQQRSLMEKEKLKQRKERATTPTLFQRDQKSRVARAGAPGSTTPTSALGRRRDAANAVINSTYRSRLNMGRFGNNGNDNDVDDDENNNNNGTSRKDGKLKLDTLKKTENFRKVRGQFFHLLYGSLYEAMGGEGL